MSLFHPANEPGFPDNCITFDDFIAGVERVIKKNGWRVTAAKVDLVGMGGRTLKLSFDRKKVGQPVTHELEE